MELSSCQPRRQKTVIGNCQLWPEGKLEACRGQFYVNKEPDKTQRIKRSEFRVLFFSKNTGKDLHREPQRKQLGKDPYTIILPMGLSIFHSGAISPFLVGVKLLLFERLSSLCRSLCPFLGASYFSLIKLFCFMISLLLKWFPARKTRT